MEKRTEHESLSKISGWFVPILTYRGNKSVPESIRSQWLGMALPIREHHAVSRGQWTVIDTNNLRIEQYNAADVIMIDASDAIKALKLAKNEEAANWWIMYYGVQGADVTEAFVFFPKEDGKIFSPEEMEEYIPSTAQFDETII